MSLTFIVLLAQLTSAWTILELWFTRNDDSWINFSSDCLNRAIGYVLLLLELGSSNWKWSIGVTHFVWEIIGERYGVCSWFIKNLCAIVDDSLRPFIQSNNSLISCYKTVRIDILKRSSLYNLLRRRCLVVNWLVISDDLWLDLLSNLWCEKFDLIFSWCLNLLRNILRNKLLSLWNDYWLLITLTYLSILNWRRIESHSWCWNRNNSSLRPWCLRNIIIRGKLLSNLILILIIESSCLLSNNRCCVFDCWWSKKLIV